jgi:hypothetical protein
VRFTWHHIPQLLLALVLIATSASMATARDQIRAAVGQMQLCTGLAVVTVLMDHNGQPMETPHICPDCVVVAAPDPSGLALAVTLFGGPEFQPRQRALKFETVEVRAPDPGCRPVQARAPPPA